MAKPFVATTMPPLFVLLNPFIWLFWAIDLMVWLLFPLPGLGLVKMILTAMAGKLSYALPGDTTIRRKTGINELKKTPYEGLNTVHELVRMSVAKHGPLECMGTRTFLGMHTPPGGKFGLKIFGDTTWNTYAEMGDTTAAFGRGLVACGMVPLKNSSAVSESFKAMEGPSCLLIFEETCADWMMASIGAMSQSLVVATSYSTLGMGAVAEAIKETSAPAILCNYKDVARVATLAASCPSLKTIIYSRNYVEASAPPAKVAGSRLKVMSFDEVVALGNEAPHASKPFTPPSPDQLGLIMYTSGSTGKPKGVMLKHSAIVAAVGGMFDYVSEFAAPTTPDWQEVYLAYLPAAHILEFAVETGMLIFGAKVGYSDPKTISSKGAVRQLADGSLNGEPTGFGKSPPGGIQEFAPTIMAAVPKIWDILKKGVESVMGKASPVVQSLFLAAFASRSAALKMGRKSPVCDKIFGKTYKMLGGRLKLCISGGGPISSEIQNFIRVAFKVNLVQGYGLTETCAAGTVQSAFSFEDGVVGAPTSCVEVKLASCLDEQGLPRVEDRDRKPYLNTDKAHYGVPCLGRGEVWMRGTNVSSGYYMQEGKTKEEFDPQGWFHTGDIAIWTTNGQLKIVDRLKNLVKLKGGEYVAIESMEATYAQSVFVNGVNGGLMCYADGDMDRPVALVQVNDYELKKWADGAGVSYGGSLEKLCAHPEATKMVCADLNRIGKGVLGGNEALAAVALLPGSGAPDSTGPSAPWTPENTYLTASNKLNRKPIESGFAQVLADTKAKGIR